MNKLFLSMALISALACLSLLRYSYAQNEAQDSHKKDMADLHQLMEMQKKMMDQLFNDFFDDQFFGSREKVYDPFEEMKRMREKFRRHFNNNFGNHPKSQTTPEDLDDFDSIFDGWYGQHFGGSLGDIKSREDNNFVYYDIEVEGLDKNTVDIKVENGAVKISGKTTVENEKVDKNGTQQEASLTQFSRSIPVPDNVDASKVDITSKDNIIILKFPKTKQKTPKQKQYFQGGRPI